jgi:hypothetical protein
MIPIFLRAVRSQLIIALYLTRGKQSYEDENGSLIPDGERGDAGRADSVRAQQREQLSECL